MSGSPVVAREPGRELDAMIAERVMGWLVVPFGQSQRWEDVVTRYPAMVLYEAGGWTVYRGGGAARRSEEWRPSTDIAAAWLVVEKLKERAHVSLHSGPDDEGGCDHWTCRVESFGYRRFQDQSWQEQADTAPLAICRAALLSVGG